MVYIVYECERYPVCECDFPEQCSYSHELYNISETDVVLHCESSNLNEAFKCFKIDPFNRMIWDAVEKRRIFAVTCVSEMDSSRRCVAVKDDLGPCDCISKFLLPFYDLLQDIGASNAFPPNKCVSPALFPTAAVQPGRTLKRPAERGEAAESLFKRARVPSFSSASS